MSHILTGIDHDCPKPNINDQEDEAEGDQASLKMRIDAGYRALAKAIVTKETVLQKIDRLLAELDFDDE